jgi:hypothetical protein
MPCHRDQNAVPPGSECRATGIRVPCRRERNAVPLSTGSGMPCPALLVGGRFAIEIAFLRPKLPLDRERNAVPKWLFFHVSTLSPWGA